MAEAAVLKGGLPVRRWVAGTGQSGVRVTLFLLAPTVFVLAVAPFLSGWLKIVPPEWSAPFVGWINAAVEMPRREEIFGLLTLRDMTRAIADLIDCPLDFVEAVLVAGFSESVPGLPWIAVAGLAIVLGWYLQGRQLGIIAGICFAYMAIIGKWELSMVTLKVVPVAIFIGIGHKAGTIATIVFAFPITARLTILGLKGASPEVREAGIMAGRTPRQLLWKVRMPLAFPAIVLGINQTIMYALFTVVCRLHRHDGPRAGDLPIQGGQQRGQVAGRRSLHRLPGPDRRPADQLLGPETQEGVGAGITVRGRI